MQDKLQTRQLIRDAVSKAFVSWLRNQRDLRGDLFATDQEVENIINDPIGNLELLKGEDAYQFVRALLAGADEAHQELVDGVNAYNPNMFDGDPEGCDECMTYPCSCDAEPEVG